MIGKPKIDTRPEISYMGIREQMPMSSMDKNLPPLFNELSSWVEKQGVELAGTPFLRYHVIDMAGEMDIEAGFPVVETTSGDARVKPGVLPAGRYASLIFQGDGYEGNKALIEWARDNNLKWDRWDDPKGDAFRSRYETYLTDPEVEPDIMKWDIEVAIKLADE